MPSGGGIPDKGEVYEYRDGHVLVLARRDKMCTVVKLREKDDYCDVQVRGFWYTNIYQISHINMNRLGDFEFRLTNEEMNNIKKAMSDAFGVQIRQTTPEQIKEE